MRQKARILQGMTDFRAWYLGLVEDVSPDKHYIGYKYTSNRLLQLLNAQPPATPSGIVILFKLVIPSNARSPISFIVSHNYCMRVILILKRYAVDSGYDSAFIFHRHDYNRIVLL